MTRRWAVPAGTFCAAIVLLAAAPLVAAQESAFTIAGRILDADGRPAAGYRVVLRVPGGTEVHLGPPAGVDGSYQVSVPAGRSYVVAAVIAPSGKRTTLDGLPEIATKEGAKGDVQLPFSIGGAVWPATFAGGDRLFVAWAEDAVIVDGGRFEAWFEHDEFDSTSIDSLEIVGAVSFASIPRVEFGGRSAYAGFESETGLTDTDAWVKLDLGQRLTSRTRFAAGGLVTFPTGDPDAALGADAFGSKLFGAVRAAMDPVLVSGHVGVRFTGDGEVAGSALDGTTSVDAGVAAIWPVDERLAWIAELSYEGERFEDTEADARLLFGTSWKPLDFGHARIAAGAGLTDGAPDWLVLAGWSFEP
jgi:hypothetical protein